jgi:IS5 family transposase
VRIKLDPQGPLEFGESHLQVTQDYYAKYGAINGILRDNPQILTAFHEDAARGLSRAARRRGARGRRSTYTSEQLLRSILVMEIEGLSYRATTIRIDDSVFLRRFVGIPTGPMLDFTTLQKVYKAINPETWKKINKLLGRYAIDREFIEGSHLRVDTTAYETNVHYPTDSSLLWDTYRVLSRLIARVREYDEDVVGPGRLQDRRVKRLVLRISRQANQTEKKRLGLKRPYQALLGHVGHIVGWSQRVRSRCRERLREDAYGFEVSLILAAIVEDLKHYEALGQRVIDQTRRRVLEGEKVPNSEKTLSIFEPHTELLKRGKAVKPVEFGHMVLLHEVENQFISNYEVFERRPADASLVDEVLEQHRRIFGKLPEALAADKGFYESMPKLYELEKMIPNVSIAKKGSRTSQEMRREHEPIFRILQRFRAGIEGTISVMKRAFKMWRCLYRSFRTYGSSVGSHVFAHNIVVLARL